MSSSLYNQQEGGRECARVRRLRSEGFARERRCLFGRDSGRITLPPYFRYRIDRVFDTVEGDSPRITAKNASITPGSATHTCTLLAPSLLFIISGPRVFFCPPPSIILILYEEGDIGRLAAGECVAVIQSQTCAVGHLKSTHCVIFRIFFLDHTLRAGGALS
jgi:hypothetical protein